MVAKHNTPWSVYNSKMNRVIKGHNITYPSYFEVINYIGEKPEDTPYFSYIMCQYRDYSKDLKPSDFFWNRQLNTSTLNKVHRLYPHVRRQQIKKALQKLSAQEIKDVLDEKKLLSFKRPYFKTDEYYRSFVGSTFGSYLIKDLWRVCRQERTEYRFVVECSRCHKLITKRVDHFLRKIGILCLRCTYGSNRPHKNSALLGRLACYDNDEIYLSEYSRYSSQGMFAVVDSMLDSDYNTSDILNIFGTSYF